jgi:NTE family protein
MNDTTVLRAAAESGAVVRSAPAADGSTHLVTVASTAAGQADLVLEGGGVKGLGLVGATLALSEAGYDFQRVAGASAGAIVATLIAALDAAKRPIAELEEILSTIDYTKFAPGGMIEDVAKELRLFRHEGLYNGDYLVKWLGGQLEKLNITTFRQLAIVDDSLPAERRYSLVVLVSDLTRGKSVRLPWDYAEYGLAAGDQLLVSAVRASMSIPFFFTPVHIDARPTEVDGEMLPAQTCTWVDGGMLDNFPIDVFASDTPPGRWPTIGVKLSARGVAPPRECGSDVQEAMACLATLLDNADRCYITPADAQRTIFVDHGDVRTTEFSITPQQQQMLLANGRAAAEAFLAARPAQPPAS